MSNIRLIQGDCREVLTTLESASVDCVVTDPPYPCIKRSYGTWTEAEWWELMRAVVPQCMRVLKPSGSAVFILQPNSERVGRMRPWLFDFQAWVCREFGMVQDVWWWNHAALPSGGATDRGLLRGSLKPCVWVGPESCYRNQDAVLWSESQSNIALRTSGKCGRTAYPCGREIDHRRIAAAAERRGGTTPFNVLPIANTNSTASAGAHGHGAGTPAALASWWLRYICPPEGVCLDPFSGSGTVALEAAKQGKQAIGIEAIADYHAIATKRLAAERNGALFA